MAGITANGRGWKLRIVLSPAPFEIGKLNTRLAEEGISPTREELEPLVEDIVRRVRSFSDARFRRNGDGDEIAREFAFLADDLEMVADCDIEEVNEALDFLYDAFDYWHVLVN